MTGKVQSSRRGVLKVMIHVKIKNKNFPIWMSHLVHEILFFHLEHIYHNMHESQYLHWKRMLHDKSRSENFLAWLSHFVHEILFSSLEHKNMHGSQRNVLRWTCVFPRTLGRQKSLFTFIFHKIHNSNLLGERNSIFLNVSS